VLALSFLFVSPVSALEEVTESDFYMANALIEANLDMLFETAEWAILDANADSRAVRIYNEFGNDISDEFIVEIAIVDTTNLVRGALGSDEGAQTMLVRSFWNRPLSGMDPSLSVRATNTIFWTAGTANGWPTVRLTEVSGNHTILDNQVQVIEQNLRFGANGVNANGVPVNNQLVNQRLVGTSYRFTPNWVAIRTTDGLSAIGSSITYTLRRGTSSIWTFTINNQLY